MIQFQREYENNQRYSSFQAIPELQVPSADIGIRLIRTNVIRFAGPNDDPMFSAHKEVAMTSRAGYNETYYMSDAPATMLGCTE